jgi:hypothetical protein
MLEYETEGADRWVIGRELMMVKVAALRGVFTTDIDDGDAWICQILGGGLAPDDGHGMDSCEQGAGEEFVFMSAAGMSEDESQ